MKLRLVLLVLALAILALAGVSNDCARSIEAQHGGGPAARLSAPQPASESETPVLVRATATSVASSQTVLEFDPHIDVVPALRLSGASRQVPADPGYDSATPQSFPLLI